MTKPVEDPLVAQAFDAKKHEDLARAIEKLSSEEAAFFLHKLEMALRKRKIQITGYLVAMAVWLVGMMFALAYTGMHDGFVGWVFIAPFGLVGLVLYLFGKWANSASRRPPPVARAVASGTAATTAVEPTSSVSERAPGS
ncbi:MAG TPA: hypothetical protein VLM79_17400 [Kofleriaceae bacterium]|nr:hypothetical protein [Kofleriaceae bacterium]